MAKENFSELSTEDLVQKKNTVTFIMGLLVGGLSVLFILTIFQTISKGVTLLVAVPFALLPFYFMCNSQINSMDKELKSRKSN